MGGANKLVLQPRAGWAALHREVATDPDLPIVDTHQHFFDRPGWRYMLEELGEDLSAGHQIAATVFVECNLAYRDGGAEALRPVGETERVRELADEAGLGTAPTQIAAAIVAHTDLTLGARVDAVLEAHIGVSVKLGGLGMWAMGFSLHERERPPTSETLCAMWRPYFAACVDAFGAGRCMFESNFPVDQVSYGYGTYWNACKAFAIGASSSEKADLFHRTAVKTYRLAGVVDPAGVPGGARPKPQSDLARHG